MKELNTRTAHIQSVWEVLKMNGVRNAYQFIYHFGEGNECACLWSILREDYTIKTPDRRILNLRFTPEQLGPWLNNNMPSTIWCKQPILNAIVPFPAVMRFIERQRRWERCEIGSILTPIVPPVRYG